LTCEILEPNLEETVTVDARGAAAMSEPVLSVRPAKGRPPTRLRIATRPAGGRTTVVVVGDVDMDTRGELRESLGTALSASDGGIDLDLSGVGFCDCSGLNVLLLVQRLAAAAGRTVVIRSASPTVERLLTLTGTAPLFAPAGLPAGCRAAGAAGAALPDQYPRPGTAPGTTEESPLSHDATDTTDTTGAVDAVDAADTHALADSPTPSGTCVSRSSS
jgi:anti-anti-sigma factor